MSSNEVGVVHCAFYASYPAKARIEILSRRKACRRSFRLPLIKMPLKPDKGVAYLGYAAKLCRRITDGPVFQLQQVR
jgi:hypothetical protein